MVRVASALLSPICTVSAPKLTSPVPLGIISISAFDVETISFPFTSKLPPSCGEVSSTTAAIPPAITTSSTSGFVPSFLVAEIIFQPLLLVAQVTVSPEPVAYFN